MKSQRLLDQLQPKSYTINVTPNIKAMTFTGQVTILATLPAKGKHIVLHAKGIEIDSAKATTAQAASNLTWQAIADDETIILTAEQTLSAGEVEIQIDYRGVISDSFHGLYASTYKDSGADKVMLATQFESIHARNFVPCIDEPAAKAVFELSVTIPKDMIAVSNTLPADELVAKQHKTIRFKPTPKMSSYLLALIVGDLGYVETVTKSNITIRTYAAHDQLKHADVSLELATKALDFYQDYFNIDYPLENLNMIALPDVEAGVGAMENWGCIVYRADSLLVDPNNTSIDMKVYNAIVIAHEIAHQWFGNLVTMAWWDDLWLNEGFAAWIEYEAVNVMRPEWNIWEEYVSTDFTRALYLDSLTNTHAIQTDVTDPLEIVQNFDDITYRKGAASIRMLQQYLGAKTFQKGIQRYLKAHAYANATTLDLWEALAKTSGKDVANYMDHWIRREGHPIVTVEADDNGYSLRQQRFALSGKHSDDKAWPLALSTFGTDKTELFDKREMNLAVSGNDFPVLNKAAAGFWRLKLPSRLALEQAEQLVNQQDYIDSVRLLADLRDQMISGDAAVATVLDIAAVYADEADAHIWDQLAANIGLLRKVFDDDATNDGLRHYAGRLSRQLYEEYGHTPHKKDNHNAQLLKPTLFALAAADQHPEAKKQVKKLFADALNGKAVNPDYSATAYVQIARYGGQKEYDQLKKLYSQTEHAEEQRRLTGALCSFDQPELIQNSLDMIQSKDVRLQDAYVWVVYLLRNRKAKHTCLDWLIAEWPWIEKSYGRSLVYSSLIRALGSAFSDEVAQKTIKDFLGTIKTSSIERSINQSLELLDYNVAMRRRSYDDVQQWLAHHSQ